MVAYYDVYLDDVVENQGKLFDYVSYNFPKNPYLHMKGKNL